ncbi:MAG: AlbA family DNA-binding domain-containing protein, partial [Candidatus Binatia bacterium]
MQGEDIGLLLRQERGQFLEFVSAYEHKKAAAQKKQPEELAREIMRLLAGMANADGGSLLVGVEPDKSVTGIPYSAEEIHGLLQAAQTLLSPPLYPSCEKIHLGNLLLLRLHVGSAFEVHRLVGGRTFYRIATDNPAASQEQIQSLREAKKSSFFERQHAVHAGWEDLDPLALEAFTDKIQDRRDSKAILTQPYHLIDNSQESPTLTIAALLLFGKDLSRWHPRCGIDFVKYEGTERQHGSSLNIVKRIRFEAPLY